jgi:hypothetical protein
MNGFQVRTTAKYKTLCLRCFRAIKVGQAIVQEDNGKWSHAVCTVKPRVATPCVREEVKLFSEEK